MPAVQQDVAPTLAAALGVQMPPTATGRVLPVLRTGFARPRVVMLLVLDGMRRDYFDRYAASMPTLTALRQRSAWFTQAQVNFLPTNTAVGHSTHLDGSRSSRARNHRRQRVRSHAPPAPRPIRWRNAARSDGIDAGRRLAARDGWSRDHTGTGQHRPSGDAARGAWSVSVEWSASRARKLRSADGQLDHEPQLFPAACISEGSQCENTVAGERGVDGSQNRLDRRGALFGSVSGIRSRCDDRDD